jgi:hypothetical protein
MPAGVQPIPPGPNTVLDRRVPIGAAALLGIKSSPLPKDPDAGSPVEQSSGLAVIGSTGGPPTPQDVEGNCSTNTPNGSAPPDIHGAAGNTNLVVVTNTSVGVYRRADCATLSSQSLATLFSPFVLAAGESLFDPRIIYDPAVSRFFLTVESRNSNNSDQFQYFAVSQDSTGLSWWLYRFALSQGASFFCKVAANSFWDYPSAGYNTNRWLIASNDFPSGGGASGAILSIDKAASLTGGALNGKCFFNLTFNIAPPVVPGFERNGLLPVARLRIGQLCDPLCVGHFRRLLERRYVDDHVGNIHSLLVGGSQRSAAERAGGG